MKSTSLCVLYVAAVGVVTPSSTIFIVLSFCSSAAARQIININMNFNASYYDAVSFDQKPSMILFNEEVLIIIISSICGVQLGGMYRVIEEGFSELLCLTSLLFRFIQAFQLYL